MTMDEMDRLADLKAALSPTSGPSVGLRDRTLASLADPAPSRRRWAGPIVAAAALAATALGAVALVGGSGGTGTPPPPQPAAFSVSVNADGSVTFAAHDIVDSASATQALNNAGITGRVINDQTPGCATKAHDIAPADLYPDNTIGRGLGTSDTVTLRSSDYPTGGGLLVVITSRGEDTGRAGVAPDPVSVAIFAFDDAGKIPTCVDFSDPGSS
jgi:hypothetical protein